MISESPTDVQPVLDTIAAAALKLCSAASGSVLTFDGELVHQAALANVSPRAADALRNAYPRPPGRDTAGTRAVLTRSVVAIPDVLEDPDYRITGAALGAGFRGVLAVPMIRDGARLEPSLWGGPSPGTSPTSKSLCSKPSPIKPSSRSRTCGCSRNSGQRNRDLTEALEQQTATSDILRVISQSQTDVQPVFDTIAKSVLALCRAQLRERVYVRRQTHPPGRVRERAS